ncbi:MAG: hypothetical protein JXA90_13710 [Planctomycetes bacterium]|nr:hypothetical protein [Planctomycetota bacterium]
MVHDATTTPRPAEPTAPARGSASTRRLRQRRREVIAGILRDAGEDPRRYVESYQVGRGGE